VLAEVQATAVAQAATANATLATRANTAAPTPTLETTTATVVYLGIPGADVVPITLQRSTCEQLATADQAGRAQQIPQLVTRGEANLVPLNTTGHVVTVGTNCAEIAVLDGAFQARSVWVPKTAVQTARVAQQAVPAQASPAANSAQQQQVTANGASTSNASIENQLAVAQRGGQVSPNDPLIRQFAVVLNSLQSKCSESRLDLGNEAVAVWKLLQQHGVVGATLLGLLRDTDSAVPAAMYGPGHPAKCSEFVGLMGYLEEANGGP
jgi:hypothetical protein